jgi:hypothetical protein
MKGLAAGATRLAGSGVALGLALCLAGCGQPVPRDKSAFVGEWQHPTMYLLLTPDGSVRYKRLSGGASKSIEGPLQGFHGNDFDVGIGPMSTTFVVSKPPHAEGGRWHMEVDGVDLVRTSSLGAPQAPADPVPADGPSASGAAT